MITMQEIIADVMMTIDIVKGESLGKGTFRSEKAAQQIGIEPSLMDSFLRANWTVDTIIRAIQETPNKSMHPLICAENRTPFIQALIRFDEEEQEL